ncbi:hypothetical protein [Streptomyces sp. NPDC058739]|uniref:hypothetical protein n=1 Tax=Streptomyces sp. NPDC058739 TaxID=3346618 RepID=UPI0036C2D6C5
MPPIEALLARARLHPSPDVPGDTVAYHDTPYLQPEPATPAPAPAPVGPAAGGRPAADHLQEICEAIVTAITADDLQFLTHNLPEPHAAWLLGCALQLADVHDGARFWWQYAAGAQHPAAAYCLSLHHHAHSEDHAAAFWYAQSGLQDAVDCDTVTVTGIHPPLNRFRFDTDVPTVLRVLSRLAARRDRARPQRADALTNYVADAVTRACRHHPDIEIPLPETRFASRIAFILAATTPWTLRPERLLQNIWPSRTRSRHRHDTRPLDTATQGARR